jgi:hypothetical protein
MIRQKPGDLLEIRFDDKFYYVIVLTPIVMFGGNIIFAFHGDGTRLRLDNLYPEGHGFNVCTDLRLPKKEGDVSRVAADLDLAPYWRTRFAKGCLEYRKGHKAQEWWIYPIDDLQNHIARTSELSSDYQQAMDRGCFSFDLVADMILQSYTPDQNPFL